VAELIELSTRQRQILDMVVLGASNEEIGDVLYLSVDTVKTHLRQLREKIKDVEVNERVQLAVWAVRTGHYRLQPCERDWHLTAKEVAVLQAVADYGTNVSAADVLYLSPLTVKSHLARIARKMGTGRRVCMVVRAIQAGQVKAR